MRGVVAMVGVVLVGAVLPAPVHSEDPVPSLSGDGPLEMATAVSGATATISILNDSPTKYVLAIEAVLDQPAADAAPPIVNDAEPDMVPDRGRADVALSLGDGWDGATAFTGWLTVTATQVTDEPNPTVVVLRAPLTLTPGATYMPAVTKHTVTVYRDSPWTSNPAKRTADDIALTSPDACPGIDGPNVFLTSGTHVIVVPTECRSENIAGQPTSLDLDIPDLPPVGEFTGSLATPTAVELTILSTTRQLWPVVFALLGIFFAALVFAYVDQFRLRMTRRIPNLDTKAVMRTSQGEFDQNAKAVGMAAYRFQENLHHQVDEIDGKFQKIALRTDTKDLDEQARALRDLAIRWRGLPIDVRRMRDAADALTPTVKAAFPARLGQIGKIGTNEPTPGPISVADAEKLVQEIDDSIVIIELLSSAHRLIDRLEQIVKNPPQSKDDEWKDAVSAAREEVQPLKEKLDAPWEQGKLVEMRKHLADGYNLVVAIPKVRKPIEHRMGSATPAALEERAEEVELIEPPFGRPAQPVPPADTADNLRAWVRRWDWAVFAVVATVAVWTALQNLYFDKAWGTWRDVVAMTLWALGATAIVTPVLTAAVRLLQRRFDLPPAG